MMNLRRLIVIQALVGAVGVGALAVEPASARSTFSACAGWNAVELTECPEVSEITQRCGERCDSVDQLDPGACPFPNLCVAYEPVPCDTASFAGDIWLYCEYVGDHR